MWGLPFENHLPKGVRGISWLSVLLYTAQLGPEDAFAAQKSGEC